MRLTEEQRNAVRETGHVCLTSCPGSGKTRVIVAKLLKCIQEVDGSTRRVACITHTNPAADEIEHRLRETCFGGEDLYYDVCTIHGFALQNILRPFHHLLPEFTGGFEILTSQSEVYETKAKELLAAYRLSPNLFDEFERTQRGQDDLPIPSESLPIQLQLEWMAWLDANQYVTLNEIVYHAGRLVTTFNHIASALASRFAWILVDEFQDSSPGQIAILKGIYALGRTYFFCVGDPNQSIYRFAGARPGLLAEFAAFIGANVNHRLTANFRSSQLICDIAESLCCSEPRMRALGRHAACTIRPEHRKYDYAYNGVLGHFIPTALNRGIPYGGMAILSPSWPSLFGLSRVLRDRGIPVIGPGARPYRRSHHIAPLVEALGGFLEREDGKMGVTVQRAVFCLVSDLTGHAPRNVYTFEGRVAICKLVLAAKKAKAETTSAVEWITASAEQFSETLIDHEFLTKTAGENLVRSAADMVLDILSRNGGDGLSVEDLGIFAQPENCVQLLTIHKSKGREFDAVAVVDMHDGKIPYFRIKDIEDDDEREEAYSESRRIVYVAATRAKQILLFLTDTSDWRNRNSPFLAEMGL